MWETNRLILKPLKYAQLVKYIKADFSLENELHLKESKRTISDELKEALEQTILPGVADTSKNYLYSTLWTIISKADNIMVGDLCIKGEPDTAGKIEIGYGTYEAYQGRGFMSEAVEGIIQWAATQPYVKAVVASTEKSNTASFTVLLKNGFRKTGETETMFMWEKKLKD